MSWFFLIAMSVWGLLTALPSFFSVPSWMPQKKITLGLDLQGGVHLLMEVGIKELERERYAHLTGWIRRELRPHKIFYQDLKTEAQSISFRLVSPSDAQRLEELLTQAYGRGAFSIKQLDGHVRLSLSSEEKATMARHAVNKSIETIRRRIDETGAVEPVIQSQGQDRIIVQIPGFDDPARVKSLLGKTAKLSFQWVSQEDGSLLLPYEEESIPVESDILLTGEDIVDARAHYTPDALGKHTPTVALTFTHKGGQIFSHLTRDNIGRRLAIVLDKTVLSAPAIESHIPTGHAVITGMKDMEDAQKLALMIRSGALPAPLHILEEKVVGPGLGQDSIQAGTRATALAILAVALWMMMIYSYFGGFAVIGLMANLCFLFAALIWLGATLTLPGLAGIALTIGMSVDANVLINERIKEELALGQSVPLAIEHGYQKARKSILDSNLTTLIGACLLYMMGTGPVRGFAITMALGILISLFTSMGLTRMLVQQWMRWRRPIALKI